MKSNSNANPVSKTVYIVDGGRTPFLKAKPKGLFHASDLAVALGKSLLNRQSFAPSELSEVIIGCAMPGPDEANIARIIALRLGCGENVPAFTVMRNCASGMQALDSAVQNIRLGQSDLVLAGGVDAMSKAPVLFNEKMVSWLASWMSAKSLIAKLKLLLSFRPSYFSPVVALMRGLTDPIVGLNMGQTAENLAFKFGLTRESLDEYATQSHAKTLKAARENRLTEIVPIIDNEGRIYTEDDGVRHDSTLEKLSKLNPYFDKKFGMVTAGNSSQITDGACLLILASGEAVKRHKLKVIGKIVDSQWVGLDPAQMGLGPVHAIAPILKRQNIRLADLDTLEINEAFAAQVLACMKAFEDEQYCKTHLDGAKPLGHIEPEKLNPDGGAIAIGHPIGASGARIVLHALKHLEATDKKTAIASICVGGGQGGAMYVERVREVTE